MIHALCIDWEEYYHAHELRIPRKEWSVCLPRIEANTKKILDLFRKYKTKSTFFVLTDLAERHGSLIQDIASEGHEIASHGHSHTLLSGLRPGEFKQELQLSKQILQKLTGQVVVGFRAPSWSVTKTNRQECMRILKEEGFLYDSSVLPWKGWRHVQGIPEAPLTIHTTEEGLTEFPPPVLRVLGGTIPFSLPTLFRLLPYAWTRTLMREFSLRHDAPAMITLHPSDIDPDQPRRSGSWISSFLHYQGSCHSLNKLERALQDFQFKPLREFLSLSLPQGVSK